MTGPRTKLAIQFLHWTVGIVVLLESVRAFLSAHGAGHAGMLGTVRLILSGGEIIAAVLFLVPAAMSIGGIALLVIFALAITIHALHGDFKGLEILVLYGAAVYLSLAERQDGRERIG
jgi:hypothetical protein